VLKNDAGRLRSGWRLLLFIVVTSAFAFGAFQASGYLPVSVAPLWREVLVSLIALLGASWLLMSRVERLPLAALGLPLGAGAVRATVSGLLVGTAVIASVVIVFALLGWVRWVPQSGGGSYAGALLRFGGFFFVAAFGEELLARGYPLQVLAEGLGGGWAIGLTSVAFGLLHLGNPNVTPVAVANITLAGLLLGIAYWRTYSLWFATGIHTGWNLSMNFLGDLPVSGLGWDTPLYDAVVSGPDLWTGGVFGPEGGLGVTCAAVVATLILARWARLRRDPHVTALEPLPERRNEPDGQAILVTRRPRSEPVGS
jgi:membrane protease YdiL (CAAX protease family)